MSWNCERWKTLPDAGGLYDQDYQLMHRMNALTNVYNAVQRIKSLKGTQIHTLTDSERMILRYLMDNRILFNA
jgi:hypothetical protein